jgi:hypothetical protein
MINSNLPQKLALRVSVSDIAFKGKNIDTKVEVYESQGQDWVLFDETESIEDDHSPYF